MSTVISPSPSRRQSCSTAPRLRFHIAQRLPADRRGNGQIDRICDALALDALVEQGQSESSLQLDDDGRLAASYGHQIAAINLGSDCIALLLQQPFYGCVEVGFVQHGHEYTR